MEMTRFEPPGLRAFDMPFNLLGDTDESSTVMHHWTPLVDLQDAGDHFALEVDVPGVRPEDINVSMENGVLNIEGERQHKERTAEKGYTRVERGFGSFQRRFSLPEVADPGSIDARVENGVLFVKIGKSEKARPRRIEVKAG